MKFLGFIDVEVGWGWEKERSEHYLPTEPVEYYRKGQ